MNIHTFKDAATDRRSALVNELADDDDDEEDDLITERSRRRGESIDGEEEATEKFNDMGEVMEPFNLKNEREAGGFDENMNYVFQKEKGEVDAWLADMDEAQMEKGIGEAAKAQKIKQDKSSAEEELESKMQDVTSSALISELIDILAPGENAWQAMRRLGSKNKKTKNVSSAVDINRLTEVADILLGRGKTNIYEMTKEGMILLEVVWEYQGQDGQIHGPFTSQQMSGWIESGFFTGDGAVLIRRARQTSHNEPNGSAQRRVSWQSEQSTSHAQEYEESKSSSESKRRRQFQANGDHDRDIKRSRLDTGTGKSTSDDLLNDLEDSDDEKDDDLPPQLQSKELHNNTSSSSLPLQLDIYAEWQSSDDIEWALIANSSSES